MSTSRIELNFTNGEGYDNRVEISIRLRRRIAADRYKKIVDAANTILSETDVYIDKKKESK